VHSERVSERMAIVMRVQREPESAAVDAGIPLVVCALDLLEWVMPYEIAFTFWRGRPARFAYYYVAVWLAVLVGILSTTYWWTGWEGWVWLFVAFPALRLADIFRWWADFLLDRRHSNLVSAERSLLFAFINLAETALVAAIWLRASGQATTAGGAAFLGFLLVTQLGVRSATTRWAQIAVVLAEITALILLLGGVAALIALVPRKTQSGKHESYSKWRRLMMYRAARRAAAAEQRR
jgi:hypothetical protein